MQCDPSELPNGLHDARLHELHVEFAKSEVRLAFAFLVGEPEANTEQGREAMRAGVLRLTGVTAMIVEPPAPRYVFSAADGVAVDGDFGAYPGEAAPPDDGLVRLWLYVSTWNARMMFTAKACELIW